MMSMKFKVQVKTQTLRYSLNQGYEIVAFPMKDSQIQNLLQTKFCYFFGTGDYNLPPTIGHRREGEVVRANSKDLFKWLTEDMGKYFPNNEMLMNKMSKNGFKRGFDTRDPWVNIPINHQGTKGWLKKTGQITDKTELEHLRHMGTSKYSSNVADTVYRDNKNKIDTNVMGKKGTVGENVITNYFKKQPGVISVVPSGDVYAKWDLEIEYEKMKEVI